MDEVSTTNLPAVVTKNIDNGNPEDTVKTMYPKYLNDVDNDLERIPDADFVELVGPGEAKMASLKMPNPKEIEKSIGVATAIVIGLKSFFEATGDLWNTIKDNFFRHKSEEIVKQTYKEMQQEQIAA